MHEAAITQALIEQVRGAMPAGATLASCRIEVGELEHLDSDVMDTMWRGMTAASALEGARLVIDRVPVRVRCGGCDAEFEPDDHAILMCPTCGAVRPQLLAGAGVLLRSLDVDTHD
jgi:hydrogenase nickel incorporation protein HypA/HybF